MTQVRSFLFLQGLATPFFARLADQLRADGNTVYRINFCAGDAAYWGKRPAWHFRLGLRGLTAFIESRFRGHGFSDVILFGDQRPIHRLAIGVARAFGARVHVFEEGYVRPNWITCERDGVNGHSSLPRDPDWYRMVNRALPDYGEGRAVRVPLPVRAVQDMAYRVANTLNPVTFPNYRTHRPKPAVLEYAGWTRRFVQLPVRERTERKLIHRVLRGQRPLFVLPLQLNGDAQIVHHSPFRHMGDVIDLVLASFARSAPPAAEILIKNHPLDTGLFPYRRHIARLAMDLDLRERVHYVENGHLPTLFEHASGVVVVNSTVGLSALHQGRPTKVLATAIYDVPGLATRADLDVFWSDPEPPDPELFHAFRNTVIHATQVNGDFFTREGIARAVNGCGRMLGERSPLDDLFDRFGRP
jgi:capsular polysaccharide export protein